MIHLIGTDHLDPDGMRRLENYLAYLRPDIISLEETEKKFFQVLKIIKELQAKPWKEIITKHEEFVEQINNLYLKAHKYNVKIQPKEVNEETVKLHINNTGFEQRVAHTYHKKHSVQLQFNESKQEVEAFNQQLKENKKRREGFNQLDVYMEIYRFIVKDPQQARTFIERQYSTNTLSMPEEFIPSLIRRDAYTAKKLLGATGNIIHIGGMDHIFGEYHPNLYDHLKDAGAVRHKLCDADLGW